MDRSITLFSTTFNQILFSVKAVFFALCFKYMLTLRDYSIGNFAMMRPVCPVYTSTSLFASISTVKILIRNFCFYQYKPLFERHFFYYISGVLPLRDLCIYFTTLSQIRFLASKYVTLCAIVQDVE